jgi:hypothetical protein
MPWFIVKQPNGTYARFSSVVDDFTHMNMIREEAVDLCREHLGRLETAEKMQRADDEVPCQCSPERHQSPRLKRAPLTRWRECIREMRDLGKRNEARERIGSDREWRG